jgi:branched-chain amino acid transport system ATP-binding protein
VAALDGVEMSIPEGQVVGIIGPNGAGKTTLFDCISGFRRPDSGSIRLHGVGGVDGGADGAADVELTQRASFERTALGVGRTFQNARLFRSMPIRDILRTVQHDRMHRSGFLRSIFGVGGSVVDEREAAERADEVLELVGLSGHADKPAMELSTGMLRLCELAAVVAVRPRLLLLDEPSSGIAQKETEALAPLLRQLTSYLGATMLLIEGISDTIIAMAAGKVITSGAPEAVRAHPDVLTSYLGAKASAAAVSA